MQNTISATSDNGVEFTISDIKIFPAGDRSINPNVAFTLNTPYGIERFETDVLDGYLPRADGCYIDQRRELEIECEEDVSDLLYAVNKALRPAVANASISLDYLEIIAEVVGASIWREDGNGDESWTLRLGSRIDRMQSLHEVEAAIKELDPEGAKLP